MELEGLAEMYHRAADDEGWSVPALSKDGMTQAQTKPGFRASPRCVE